MFKTRSKKGILIVFEGIDGSGKFTQSKSLVEFLKSSGYRVKFFDFPQYSSFHGKTVARLLRGEFGNIEQVSPYLASLAYSLDRASVKNQMEKFINEGGIIIANRYATSNIAHQGAKIKNGKEKKEFINWVTELEYDVNKIPRENWVIYLHIPTEISTKLTQIRKKRNYLDGKDDIHEKSLNYLKNVELMYNSLSNENKNWIRIDCTIDGNIISKEAVHKNIIKVLKEKKIIDKEKKP